MNDYETNSYAVYILECADGTLYTGITNDPPGRLRLHNKGVGAKFTKGRRPCRMIACMGWYTQGDALRLERLIKSRPRRLKQSTLENFKWGHKVDPLPS